MKFPSQPLLMSLCLMFGCATTSQQASVKPDLLGNPCSTNDPNRVVAEFNGKIITLEQLDAEIATELEELEKQREELRKKTLERMVVSALVKTEAAKSALTEEEWLRREIAEKVSPPSEEEKKRTFNDAQHDLPAGAKYEDYQVQLAEFLLKKKKQERARTVFDQLEAKVSVKRSLPVIPKVRKHVSAEGPSLGPDGAPVTLVEFSDFQCPFCFKASSVVEEVMKAYPGKVRRVFRQFPLGFHDKASKAAEAALCAYDQGKFWEYHDVLFMNQNELSVEGLKKHATTLGLDAKTFALCLDSGSKAKQVERDMEEGGKAGVSGTPTFFINGRILNGAVPVDEFREIIDEELGASNRSR